MVGALADRDFNLWKICDPDPLGFLRVTYASLVDSRSTVAVWG